MSSLIERSLHPELWIVLSSSLTRRNLANLCLTSSIILRTTRPMLYRKVQLDDRHHNTIRLLANDKHLADSVLEFEFRISNYHADIDTLYPSPVLDHLLEGITSMLSLRRLQLHLATCLKLFEEPARQQKFLDYFNGRTVPLHGFCCLNSLTPVSDFPRPGFPLSRLTTFRWDDCNGNLRNLHFLDHSILMSFFWSVGKPGSIENTSNLAYLWDILRASQETLEEICLLFVWYSIHNPLWKMRFPQLCRVRNQARYYVPPDVCHRCRL